MLILTCQNLDGRPTSTYQWTAYINERKIDEGTVVHRRADGWRALVRKVARQGKVKGAKP